jgi:hypothetical protein
MLVKSFNEQDFVAREFKIKLYKRKCVIYYPKNNYNNYRPYK